MCWPDDHGLLHGDDDAVPVRGAAGADLALLTLLTLLSTMEVLGKLMFISPETVFIVIVILAMAIVSLLLRMPNIGKPHSDTN